MAANDEKTIQALRLQVKARGDEIARLKIKIKMLEKENEVLRDFEAKYHGNYDGGK